MNSCNSNSNFVIATLKQARDVFKFEPPTGVYTDSLTLSLSHWCKSSPLITILQVSLKLCTKNHINNLWYSITTDNYTEPPRWQINVTNFHDMWCHIGRRYHNQTGPRRAVLWMWGGDTLCDSFSLTWCTHA